jgi:hypothetical protein
VVAVEEAVSVVAEEEADSVEDSEETLRTKPKKAVDSFLPKVPRSRLMIK